MYKCWLKIFILKTYVHKMHNIEYIKYSILQIEYVTEIFLYLSLWNIQILASELKLKKQSIIDIKNIKEKGIKTYTVTVNNGVKQLAILDSTNHMYFIKYISLKRIFNNNNL